MKTKNTKPTYAVVAYTERTRGIGREGQLPWGKTLKRDMTRFKELTTRVDDDDERACSSLMNAVVMGRKTWDSLPIKPLPNRLNVVISRKDPGLEDIHHKDVMWIKTLDEAFERLEADDSVHHIFVIGGGEVYKQTMLRLDGIFATVVWDDEYNDGCDTFFPPIDPFYFDLGHEGKVVDDNGVKCVHRTYFARDPDEWDETQYLDLVKDILKNGVVKTDRTGVGTKSVFGRTMRFSLKDGTMPLLTTKRVFWRGVAEELMWFIMGSTNAKDLSNQGVNIWDANGSREFLDKLGFTEREEGDLGPVYGFQWRHFGAEYVDCNSNYDGQGVDQLKELIETIKTNPDSRRMILSAWNPVAIPKMALPPCHVMAQFYVSGNTLSCQMYQRSADMGLGVPFNIASYALLTHLIAQCCGLEGGELVHVIGDCHVYLNHVSALEEQLKRRPRPPPKIRFRTEETNIDDMTMMDFELVGYDPHPSIKMDMAV